MNARGGDGGDGGAGSTAYGDDGETIGDAGGGGGGVGRIRLNAAGSPNALGLTSPPASVGPLPTAPLPSS